MQRIHTHDSLRIVRRLALACLLPAIAIASAHAESVAQAQANYKQDKTECLNGQTGESKKTCLREAGAALNDAKNGKLEKFNTNFEQNALARCQVFKNEEDRDLCERRQREGTVSGSVAGGGDIRELTVTVPADESTPAPTSAPQQQMQPQATTPQSQPQQQDEIRNQMN
ncbi:MAG TPA: hypothetical protein VF472_16615 [Burkholderiaceae bacterium]